MKSKVDSFVKASKTWKKEIETLRAILQETKLEEDFKWSKPCYSFDGNNIAIIQPLKDFLGMMFFKGALMADPESVLVDNGPNSQAARRLEFRSVQEITKMKSTIKAYIKAAIEIEKSGLKVEFKKKPEAIPEELSETFTKRPPLKKAFDALTPGRRRAYILHFNGAKQSKTRLSRIEKCIPRILAGRGMMD